MREYSINLQGRIHNFYLPKNKPLIPLFEAIVNSLHAIEERKKDDTNFSDGYIKIEVMRCEEQTSLDGAEIAPIKGFIITDNGIGFTERNMESFLESDSTYKAGIGGKGVGRFSWLKAFSMVEISSTYKENNVFFNREFEFSLRNSYINDTLTECPSASDCLTRVVLRSYLDDYLLEVPKLLDTIAMRIVEHCLVYFLDSDCPTIKLEDNNNSIGLNQLFKEKFKTEENMAQFLIDGVEFQLLNVKIEEKSFKGNRLYLCANNRLVDSKDLEKFIIDLDKKIYERNGFWYIGVLTSNYFDDHVDMNRLSFNITESGNVLFDKITMEQIIQNTCSKIENYLEEYLFAIREEKIRNIRDYATKEAPQFRHLLKYMPEEIERIKPDACGDKLDDELYGIKRKFDKTAKIAHKKLLEKISNEVTLTDDYEEFFNKEIVKISDANSAALADYVAHRRVIIELFERGLHRKDDGKFNKEKYMHNLIYPMRSTSDDLQYEAHNLWLIDEKLSYCCYISSDIPYDNDPKQERSDILFLDHPVAVSESKNDGTEFDTIIIFELKRPMRQDYTDSDNPITQLYDYVAKIKNGEAKDKNHRIIRTGDTTKFYLYAVCDITSKMERLIDQHSFCVTPDKMGFFRYNERYNSYFEILSYDKILYDAKKRNRILFDKLGV